MKSLNNFKHVLPYIKYYFASATKYDVHSPFVYDFITKVLEDNTIYPEYQSLNKLCNELSKNRTLLNMEDYGAGSLYGFEKQKTIADILNNTAYAGKYGRLLFRMVNFYKPENILELGTGLGIATAYMALANKNAHIKTIEGSEAIAAIALENFKTLKFETIEIINEKFDNILTKTLSNFQKVDLVFVDGNHQYNSTINYFNSVLPYCSNNSIVVFDDIRWSNDMFKAWNKIIENEAVTLSLDLYKTGMVFFRKENKVKQHFVLRF